MKVFISQPMSGLEIDEIKETRKKAINYVADYIINNKLLTDVTDITVIDNLQEDKDPLTTHPLEYLGNDIIKLKDADLICFAEGWEKSRGCNIEFQVAKHYNINMIFM